MLRLRLYRIRLRTQRFNWSWQPRMKSMKELTISKPKLTRYSISVFQTFKMSLRMLWKTLQYKLRKNQISLNSTSKLKILLLQDCFQESQQYLIRKLSKKQILISSQKLNLSFNNLSRRIIWKFKKSKSKKSQCLRLLLLLNSTQKK